MTKETTSFVYVTYIRSTPDKVFAAITKPEIARRYWGHENVSDWNPGSKWEHVRANDERTVQLVGKVIEVSPPTRLVITWAVDPAQAALPLDALPPGLALAVGADASEGPLVDAPSVGVRVPRDITALAAADLPAARRWRFATRRAFTHYLPRGYHVRGFVADTGGGTYLLVRRTP